MEQFTGTQYLKIDIANSFGHDKLTFAERLHWFDQHEALLESLTQQAKEPAQFFAGTLAWRKTQQGIPTGYMVGLDATSSGLQILSLLAGDAQAAEICNLVPNGKRNDAYKIVYTEMCNILGKDIALSDYKACKQALMTHLYGSKKVPKEAYGEDTPELRAFYQAITNLLPLADELNHELVALWNPNAHAHSWTMPDGFEVVVKVIDTIEHTVKCLDQTFVVPEKVNRPKDEGLSLGANIVHSIDGMIVREMGRRCTFNIDQRDAISNLLHTGMFDLGCSTIRAKDLALLRILTAFEATGFMSAVIFEHIDQSNAGHIDGLALVAIHNLLDSLPELPFNLVCIHDCFKFHANYGNDVRQQYINILAELADSDILSAIASELKGRHVPVAKGTTNLSQLIRTSDYAIC